MELSSSLLLVIAYVVPLLMLGLIYGQLGHSQRLISAILMLLPAFYIGHFLLLDELPGWPSKQPLPENFDLLGQQIIEPQPARDIDGKITLWVQEHGKTDSRLYVIAYSKELHLKLSEAQLKQNQGRQQSARRTSGTSAPGSVVIQGQQYRIGDKQQRHLPAKES